MVFLKKNLLNPLYTETPLVTASAAALPADATAWLKLEYFQHSGSFKLRGISHACQRFYQQGAQGFACASGGNAGLAVAYTGKKLGVPVTIVVPESTTQKAITAIENQGAQLLVRGSNYNQAYQYARQQLAPNQVYIHSYDHPLLWEGHASLVDEIKAAGVVPDLVILSVGGGGLLCGVIEGLVRNSWATVPVLAVETEGAHSLAASLGAKKHVALSQIESIATSLGAVKVASKAYEYAQKHSVFSHVLSDRTAVAACLQFVQTHNQLVEPACGAALAILSEGHPILVGKKNIVVVVCGGVGSDIDQLNHWQKTLP